MTEAPGGPVRLAVLSSSTTQLLTDALGKELGACGWIIETWQSGFNQYRQDIADPASGLFLQRPHIILLHLDGEDLFAPYLTNPFRNGPEARREASRNAAKELENCLKVIRSRLPEALVVLNTICLPPIHALTGLEHHSPLGITDLAWHYNSELTRIASEQPNVLVNDVAALVTQLGYTRWFDPRLWHLARCRLSASATKALARSLAALLRAWKGDVRKCLVLDLDNILWGGIIGEDRMEGIVLGEEGPGLAFVEFQRELANLARKGILLAICSKNNEEDALEVLRHHPSMRLQLESFAARRINWRDKPANLCELAAELNLGLGSFVFIDDSPIERGLMREALPEVYVPDWPKDPSSFRLTLLDLAWEQFGRISLTEEDRSRTAMYQAEIDRRELARSSSTLEGYYRSLQMVAQIGFADQFTTPRIVQLIQKTNQFNLTTRRYTEAEVRKMMISPDVLILWLRLSDRFSDSGIVGVLITKQCSANVWTIDTMLLSCRVIGRTVENAFLGFACQILKGRGAQELIGEYIPTKKNVPAANFYRDLGFGLSEGQEGASSLWQVDLREKQIQIPEWITVKNAGDKPHA